MYVRMYVRMYIFEDGMYICTYVRMCTILTTWYSIALVDGYIRTCMFVCTYVSAHICTMDIQ